MVYLNIYVKRVIVETRFILYCCHVSSDFNEPVSNYHKIIINAFGNGKLRYKQFSMLRVKHEDVFFTAYIYTGQLIA